MLTNGASVGSEPLIYETTNKAIIKEAVSVIVKLSLPPPPPVRFTGYGLTRFARHLKYLSLRYNEDLEP